MMDYSLEPKADIAFFDMKSFYASVECVKRGLHPLKTSLCVMSRQDHNKGLILAASPIFKEVFGCGNVGRVRDLPFSLETRKVKKNLLFFQGKPLTKRKKEEIESWAEKTLIVSPRMGLYIEENLKVLEVLNAYASPEGIHPYSIDEAFVDLTHSIPYFIGDSNLSKKDQLDLLSAQIQKEIWKKTGVFSTVGMSNSNPLLAKLALDNEAKKTKTMRANWSYEDVKEKVWKIHPMTKFWGIGPRMEKRLQKLNIFSIRDLACSNPDLLKKELGVIGLQLWFHSHGVDESSPSKPYKPSSTSLGNSQILPRDYEKQEEVEIVLREIAEQVAIRIRRDGKKARTISLYVGFSYGEDQKSIRVQKTISPTSVTGILTDHVLKLFRSRYEGGAVRRLGITYGNLVSTNHTSFSLFDHVEEDIRQEKIDQVLDEIREEYGFLSVQRASSLLEGSRVIERSNLIGGHCGGMDGLE